MEAGFFRRVIEGLPRNSDTCSQRAMQDHDLDDFPGYPAAEIAAIAKFPDELRLTPDPVPLDSEDAEEENDISSDDDCDASISDSQLARPPCR
jgi:hypothetical protein